MNKDLSCASKSKNVCQLNSSSDDGDSIEEKVATELEEQFMVTLQSLKKKDPKIYDSSYFFFKENNNINSFKKDKEKCIYLRDYERNLLLGKEVIKDENTQLTYDKDLEIVKKELSSIVNASDEEFILKKKENNNTSAPSLSAVNNNMQVHKNCNIEDSDDYLEDYIINKRYVGNSKDDYVPHYDEIVHDSDLNLSEDEKNVEQQEVFENKYNFRLENPDKDFIKSYPRTSTESMRRVSNKRKLKRDNYLRRKKVEKERKKSELLYYKSLKKKEVFKKLTKLNNIIGNEGFNNEELKKFDSNNYDNNMNLLFDSTFYSGEVEKKNISTEGENVLSAEDHGKQEPELSPKFKLKNKKFQSSESNTCSDVHRGIYNSNKIPVHNPLKEIFEAYFDKYYKLDFEDLIDDIPCRFKYREVTPNDFGLSTEEILLADDKELNKWSSLKKVSKYRSNQEELHDLKCYDKKRHRYDLKKKLLSSVYAEEEPNEMKLKNTKLVSNKIDQQIVSACKSSKLKGKNQVGNPIISCSDKTLSWISDSRLKSYGINPKKFRNRLKYKN